MGYDTSFEGRFEVGPAPLAPEHANYLRAFSEQRRVAWNEAKIRDASDPAREAALLSIGDEGAYFTGAVSENEVYRDGGRVADHNRPPDGQPSLYCQWVPTASGQFIEWDGNEKFSDYVDWIKYLITHFLAPWGYRLNGTVGWQGEDADDYGLIRVINNHVAVLFGQRGTYDIHDPRE